MVFELLFAFSFRRIFLLLHRPGGRGEIVPIDAVVFVLRGIQGNEGDVAGLADFGGLEDQPVWIGTTYPFVGVFAGRDQHGNAFYRVGFGVAEFSRQQYRAIEDRDAGRVIGDRPGIEIFGEMDLDLIAVLPVAADKEIAMGVDRRRLRDAIDEQADVTGPAGFADAQREVYRVGGRYSQGGEVVNGKSCALFDGDAFFPPGEPRWNKEVHVQAAVRTAGIDRLAIFHMVFHTRADAAGEGIEL